MVVLEVRILYSIVFPLPPFFAERFGRVWFVVSWRAGTAFFEREGTTFLTIRVRGTTGSFSCAGEVGGGNDSSGEGDDNDDDDDDGDDDDGGGGGNGSFCWIGVCSPLQIFGESEVSLSLVCTFPAAVLSVI